MSRTTVDPYWAYRRRVRARRLRAVGAGLALAALVGAIAATDTPGWINPATPTNSRHLREHLR